MNLLNFFKSPSKITGLQFLLICFVGIPMVRYLIVEILNFESLKFEYTNVLITIINFIFLYIIIIQVLRRINTLELKKSSLLLLFIPIVNFISLLYLIKPFEILTNFIVNNNMFKFALVSVIFLLLSVFFLYKFGYITFNKAKFEKKSNIHIQDNSFLKTLKYFSSEVDTVRLKDKIIFFNSYTSWCGYCIKEIPLLNKIKEKYKKDTNIVFLSYCSDIEKSKIDSFLKAEHNLMFNFEKIASKQGLRISLLKYFKENNKDFNIDNSADGVPVNIITNSKGKVLYNYRAITSSDTNMIYKILGQF
jgi:thiol-disulfide isomerase/thioredoxin